MVSEGSNGCVATGHRQGLLGVIASRRLAALRSRREARCGRLDRHGAPRLAMTTPPAVANLIGRRTGPGQARRRPENRAGSGSRLLRTGFYQGHSSGGVAKGVAAGSRAVASSSLPHLASRGDHGRSSASETRVSSCIAAPAPPCRVRSATISNANLVSCQLKYPPIAARAPCPSRPTPNRARPAWLRDGCLPRRKKRGAMRWQGALR